MKRSSSARPTSSDKGLPPEPPSPASPPIGVAEFQPLVSSSLTRSPEGPSSPGPAIPRPQLRGTPQQQSYNDSDSMSSNSMERGFLPRRDSRMSQTFEDLTPETRGLSAAGLHTGQNYSRYSAMPSRNSVAGFSSSVDESDVPYSSPTSLPYRASLYDTPGPRDSMASMAFTQAEMQKAATTDALLWDEKNQEGDDYLHNPDPGEFERAGNVLRSGKSTQDRFRVFSYRGITNVIGIFIIMGGLIGLFALWPIITGKAKAKPSSTMLTNCLGVFFQRSHSEILETIKLSAGTLAAQIRQAKYQRSRTGQCSLTKTRLKSTTPSRTVMAMSGN